MPPTGVYIYFHGIWSVVTAAFDGAPHRPVQNKRIAGRPARLARLYLTPLIAHRSALASPASSLAGAADHRSAVGRHGGGTSPAGGAGSGARGYGGVGVGVRGGVKQRDGAAADGGGGQAERAPGAALPRRRRLAQDRRPVLPRIQQQHPGKPLERIAVPRRHFSDPLTFGKVDGRGRA